MYLENRKKHPIKSLNPHVDNYVDSLQISPGRDNTNLSLSGTLKKGTGMIMEKMMNTKTQEHTFTKKIGQTVYIVRYHFNENAKESMQEKINRMLKTEVSRKVV